MSTRTRAVVAGVLVVAAVIALVVAFSGGGSSSSATPGASVGTPLWSVRRVPQAVVEAVGAQHLQAALDGNAGGGSCFVVKEGDHVVASHEGDTPIVGASTQKLLVAAAALDALGPDFAYVTRAVAPGGVHDGAVDQLFVVGAGDPVLTTDDYAAAAEAGQVDGQRRHHVARGVGRRDRGQGRHPHPRRCRG